VLIVDLFRHPLVTFEAGNVPREHENSQGIVGAFAVRQQQGVHAEVRQATQRRRLEERLVAERHFFRVRRFLAKVSKNFVNED
jgi:hypothetical protein